MRLGVHIRIAGGLVKALDRARDLGCEAVQLFSGNPNAWARKPVDVEQAARFRDRLVQLGIHPVILHTPYLVNLASPDDAIWEKSVYTLADAVARAPLLNCDWVVTHVGSHRGSGLTAGAKRVAEALVRALDSADGVQIALELGAGAGAAVGSRFDSIAEIMQFLPDSVCRVGICIDTAHLWGAGYDISTAHGAAAMFDQMEKNVGSDKLLVVHFNDTPAALGSHIDRHHHIGRGSIGLEGFQAILNDPRVADLPGIIETPGQILEMDRENLQTLRSLAAGGR